VPDQVQLKLDIRRVPDEQPEDILRFVHQCFPGATVDALHNGSALNTDGSDGEVAKLIAAVEAELGEDVAFRDEHFGSDARFYSEVNVPAVCFGPHGAGLHSHEEWVSIDSLEMFLRVLRRLAQQF
jgi:succinyl-diaminopimelate desuccinylase